MGSNEQQTPLDGNLINELNRCTPPKQVEEIPTILLSSILADDYDQEFGIENQSRKNLKSNTFESDKIHKKTHISRKKALSYQDLHSVCTKKRYQHVQSKVGKYIAEMKAEDEKRRAERKLRQTPSPSLLEEHVDNSSYSSLHDTCTSCKDKLDNSDRTIAMLLSEKEQLSALNDCLRTNLQEKMVETDRLRRHVDQMRFELTNANKKIKQSRMTTQPYFRTLGTQTEMSFIFAEIETSKNHAADNVSRGLLSQNLLNSELNSISYWRRRSNNSTSPSPSIRHADNELESSLSRSRSRSNDSAIDMKLDTFNRRKQRKTTKRKTRERKEILFFGKNTRSRCDSKDTNGNSDPFDVNRSKRCSFLKRKWFCCISQCVTCTDQHDSTQDRYTALAQFR